MGGNARKRRMAAAVRANAKEKEATKKQGPTTKKTKEDNLDTNKPVSHTKPNASSSSNNTDQHTRPRSTWTGKSPLDLLHEHLQKNKWDRAKWKDVGVTQDSRGRPLYLWKVNLFNPKTEEKLFFRTFVFDDKIEPDDSTEQTWNWKIGSRNNCALNALMHFFPKQPLHKHIAPEYRSVWLYLQERNQLKEEEMKIREERKEAREAKQKKFEDIEKKNALTRMNLSMTERARRKCNQIFDDLNVNVEKNKNINIPVTVYTHLKSKGFSSNQIDEYKHLIPISNSKISDEVLQDVLFETLLLHLPEHELPLQYKPSSGNFEIVPIPQIAETQQSQNEEAISSLDNDTKKKLRSIQNMGFLSEQILNYWKTNNNTSNSILSCVKDLYKQYCLGNIESITDDDKTDSSEICKEEEDTLIAIYDNDFKKEILKLDNDKITLWKLPLSLQKDKKNIQAKLIVYFDESCTYPFSVPWLQIEGVSPLQNQKMLQSLFFCYQNPQDISYFSVTKPCSLMESLNGMPMICNLLMWLEEYSIQLSSQIPNTINITNTTNDEAITSKTKQISQKKNTIDLSYKNYLPQKLSKNQIETISKEIQERENNNRNTTELKKMIEGRKKLPADKFKKEIIDLYENNDVIVLSGETGCGKTTQIPQFILENFIDSGRAGYCNMICTQPRRLSAIGVASRVAKERNEKMEESNSLVGYHVRLQKQISESCRLVFCTVGILLRRLQQLAQASQEQQNKTQKNNFMQQYLSSLSCIIIDEVHERSLDCDFLLILLKQFMLNRPISKDGRTPLKIILMSATISTTSFIEYFQSKNLKVASFHIPGFTFPVKQFFLPDVLKKIEYIIPETSAKKPKNYEETISNLKQELPNFSDDIIHSLCILQNRGIDYQLIQNLIIHLINEESIDGSILIFLPGIVEISKMKNILNNSIVGNRCSIISLHSSIPLDKQQIVFDPPPKGKVKVVLSTNIAETSVTIPDVVYVIDTGKVKQTEYDAESQISALRETFISRSSANQRSGRAGRVQEGKCFKLYSKKFYDNTMQPFDTPEIFRVPLHQVYLLTCIFLSNNQKVDEIKVDKFFNFAIESPSLDQLNEAKTFLKSVNAIKSINNQKKKLYITPLGCHISKLPVDVRIAKLLIFSTILRCVDPILTICAVLSYRSPFLSPIDNREEAKEMQEQFKRCKSDHVSYIFAYEAFIEAKKLKKEDSFCKKHFLSLSTMKMIMKLRNQFAELLGDIGFVSINKKTGQLVNDMANEQKHNLKILQACLCAGLYPNVIKIQPPHKSYTKIAAGTIEKQAKVQEFKFYTKDKKRVFLHPGSLNFHESSYESVWLVYLRIMQTSKLFVHDTTMVYPYPLLLFGSTNTSINQEKRYLIADNWMYFEADLRVIIILRKLREELDKLLENHISKPNFELDAPLLSLIIEMVQKDGLL